MSSAEGPKPTPRPPDGQAPSEALTGKEQEFARLVASGASQTEAAIQVGYAKSAAASKGSRMARSDKVRAEISRLKALAVVKAEEETGITHARVLNEHACSAFLDPLDFFDKDGNILALKDVPERARRAIASLDVEERFELGDGPDGDKPLVKIRSTKVRFNNKTASLDHISKLQNHYPSKGPLDGLPKKGAVLLLWGDE